jgi:hypothetical protein
MELFSKYKAAALADVALGDCIVVRYSLGQDKGYRHTVAIKIARWKDEQDAVDGMSAVIALWSEEGSPPFTPTLMDLRNVVEVLEIPGTGVQLSSDPAHMFWTSDPPVGALYLFGGEPHVLVEDGLFPASLISVRLTNGTRGRAPKGSVPWFPFWTVAVPDTKGRMETICSINIRKQQRLL